MQPYFAPFTGVRLQVGEVNLQAIFPKSTAQNQRYPHPCKRKTFWLPVGEVTGQPSLVNARHFWLSSKGLPLLGCLLEDDWKATKHD